MSGFGGFLNLAESAFESVSQSHCMKTGGQEYNSPDNTANSSSGQFPSFNEEEVAHTAAKHGSGDRSLFSTALGFVNSNQSKASDPVNEEAVTNAHNKVYSEGDTSGLSANALGSAAAMQVLKQFTSGSSAGSSQSHLISLAMAEASKLFDKSGGSATGDKQDAVNGAAMTIAKLLFQSKFGGITGGKDSGGLSGLMSLAQGFAK